MISLDATDFKERVAQISGTGKVPALADGDTRVWESLAILEYLAEKFPDARLWPADPAARAHARAIAAEMHAGFVPLRRHLPMNMWRPVQPARADPRGPIERATHRRHVDRLLARATGRTALFLFGTFGAADAMYAPGRRSLPYLCRSAWTRGRAPISRR